MHGVWEDVATSSRVKAFAPAAPPVARCSQFSSLLCLHLTFQTRTSQATAEYRIPYAVPGDFGTSWRFPKARQSAYMRPWGLGHREPVIPLTLSMNHVLPLTVHVASAVQMTSLSVLDSPGHMRRYRRFQSIPTSCQTQGCKLLKSDIF